jgi:hypothetical protein
MEWGLTVLSGFVVLLLLGPLVVAVSVILALVMLGHALPASPWLARAAFACPFSKRRVGVVFQNWPGAQRPDDVLSCSVFNDARGIRCKKQCLALAETRWQPSPMVPRFALIAGGVVGRNGSPAVSPGSPAASPPRRWFPSAA